VERENVLKLASLVLVLGGLLMADRVCAQEGYESEPQPVYAAPGGATVGPRGDGGGIKDNGPHVRPMMASALLYTPWRYGFGFGVKLGFEIPLVHNGFIPSINNSFSIEPYFGLGWNNYNRGTNFGLIDDDFAAVEFTPGVSVLWSFYFSSQFRAYAAIHTGVTIVNPYYAGDNDRVDDDGLDNDIDFHFELAPGIVYKLNDKIALRAELGWWSGIKGGIAILL
jgi:hypothetical protein